PGLSFPAPARSRHVVESRPCQFHGRKSGAEGSFHQNLRLFSLQFRFLQELFEPSLEHVERRFSYGPKTATLNQDRFVVQSFGPLNRLALRGKHRSLSESLAHQLKRHDPVVHSGKRRSGKSNRVYFDSLPGKAVEQGPDQGLGSSMRIDGAVNKI